MKKAVEFVEKHKKIFAAVVLLAAYFVFTELTSIYIPCVFRLITGFVCPGCGVSHMIADIAHLRFYDAVRQNYGVAVLAVMWGIVGVIYLIFKPKCLKKDGKATKILLNISIAALLAFGIIRNIPALGFLRPLYLQ